MNRIFMTGAIVAGASLLIGATAFLNATETPSGTPRPERDNHERDYQLQLGPHALAPYTFEEPLLNIAKPWKGEWRVETGDGASIEANELRAMGAIDPANGMPAFLPEGGVFFEGPGFLGASRTYPDYYSDHYRLTWSGNAFGALTHQPRDMQTRMGGDTITFSVRPANVRGRGLRFSRVGDEGVRDFSVFRNKYRKNIEAGEIWNPNHVTYVGGYDIVRTMDYQATNASPVTSFEQIATPQDAAYGVQLTLSWPPPPRYGAPYEILFDLAQRADVALWMTAPPMIGAPFHLADPDLRGGEKRNWVDPGKVQVRAKAAGADILDSPHWDEFADALVKRMIASGYSPDKPIYLELGNEIWNRAGGFAIHTFYAAGIGGAINPDWDVRQGYGVLSARWAMAVEKALAKHDRDQTVIYVLAGQAAWTGSTKRAIEGFKTYLQQESRTPAAILGKTGVSVTSYHWCSNAFLERRFGNSSDPASIARAETSIAAAPAKLKSELRDFCLGEPVPGALTGKWVLAQWKAHDRIARAEGLRLIGAYEGGSHDNLDDAWRQSEAVHDWWTDYHWGEEGADVVRQINLSLIDAFPGVILSNYTGFGQPGGSPWDDGHPAQETAMMAMWREFARPAGEK